MSTAETNTLPAPGGSFYVTGGTLPFEAASYVPRQADHDLLAGLNASEFCYVLNTRQMGKSSLMIRTAHHLRDAGATVAVLDLTAVGQNLTPEQWYDGLLMSLAEQIHLEDALEDFWNDNKNLGPLQRFMTALGKVVLPTIPQRLIVFVDEIDAVRSLPFPADEFFAAIRECYNRRQIDPIYQKLAFCLLGVATPADLIQDTRMSPFNIGRRIALTDFAPAEAAPLAQGLQGGQPVLDRVLYWTNGHPYMTQRLCRAIAEEPEVVTAGQVDALCARLFLTKQARDTDDNLAFVRNRLLRSEVDLAALLDLYQQVRAGRKVKDDETSPLVPVLRLSGVVNAPDGLLRVRNRIYDRVFDKDWVQSHMPDAELRRQEAAYRRGVLRTAAVFTAVLLMMGMLAGWALSESRRATKALTATRAALTAEKAAEKAATAQERRADQKAREAAAARQVAERETMREAAAKGLAQKDLRETQHQTQVAHHQTKAAQAAQIQTEQEKQAAEREKNTAQSAQQEALAQKANALAEKKNTQALLRVADLQLAGQAFDSEAGTAAATNTLLNASREAKTGAGKERFEWRYQWGLIHASTATVKDHTLGNSYIGVTPGGVLTVLDRAFHLYRTPLAAWKTDAGTPAVVSRKNLPIQSCFALSPDGAHMAFAAQNGQVKVQETATLNQVASWKAGGTTPLTDIEFNRGDQTVVGYFGSSSGDRSVTEWDAKTGQEFRHWTKEQFQVSEPFQYYADAWSSDGRYRAVASQQVPGHILVTDMTQLSVPAYTPVSLDAGENFITSLSFSPDGKTLATGDALGRVRLWDRATARPILAWDALTSQVTRLTFSPDGTELATGCVDGLIRLWNIQQRPAVLARSFKEHTTNIRDIEFSADGNWLAGSDSSGTAHVWNLTDRTPSRLKMSPFPLSPCFSPDGKWLAGLTADGVNMNGAATLWNTQTWQSMPLRNAPRTGKVPGGECTLSAMAFSPDGRTLALAGSDELDAVPASRTRKGTPKTERLFLQFYDWRTGHLGARWQTPLSQSSGTPWLFHLTFSPDGKTVAGAGEWNGNAVTPQEGLKVMLWDTPMGHLRRTLTGFRSNISALNFAPDARTLAVASFDKTARCFDTHTWAVTRTFTGPSPVSSVAFSPDGRTLAIGDFDGHIWLTQTRTLAVRSLIGHSLPVSGLCFSPDGRTLASADLIGTPTAKLWDVATGRETRTLPGSEFMAFSPTGDLLIAEDDLSHVRLWRAAPAAQITAWEKGEAAEDQESTGKAVLPQTSGRLWTTAAQEKAQAQALLLEIERRQVPGYARANPTANLLRPRFGQSHWTNWVAEGARATLTVGEDDLLTDHMTATGSVYWHAEVTQKQLPLETGRRYILQFRARADRERPISVWVERGVPPFNPLGLSEDLEVTPQWQAFRLPFTMQEGIPNNGELGFFLGQMVGTVQIADVILVPEAAPAGQRESLRRPRTDAATVRPQPAGPYHWTDRGEQRRQAHALLGEIMRRQVPGYARPGGAANLLRSRADSPPLSLRLDPSLGANAATEETSPSGFLTVHVPHADGRLWHVALVGKGLDMVKGRGYVLQFRARAEAPEEIHALSLADDRVPGELGDNYSSLDESIRLTPQWQAFRLSFAPGLDVAAGHGAVEFGIGSRSNTLQIADMILVPEKDATDADKAAKDSLRKKP